MSVKCLEKLDARIPSWGRAALCERRCPFCEGRGEERFIRPDGLTVRYCHTCGTFFVSPAPDDSALGEFYATYLTRYSRKAMPSPRAVLNERPLDDFRIVEMASLTNLAGKRVLDVGCGCGVLLKWFQKLGASVVGVDLDADAVRFARERLGLSTVSVGTLEDVPTERLFDVICMWDFIEHPLDPLRELERANALLAPRGLMAIWTPNASSALDDEEPIPFRVDHEHMQYLTTRTCRWLAQRLRLEILHMESVGFPGLDGVGIRHGPNGGRGTLDRLKNVARGLPGWRALRMVRRMFGAPDLRRGSYHLFCIFQKGG